MRPINLPVLDKIKVDQYGLYPGINASGLEFSFTPGSNVILGINGLGKTTLLKIIQRTLLGPFDIKEDAEIGGGKRKVVKTARDIFARRVLDHAVNATVILSFFINREHFEVVRSLHNLDIKLLKVGSTTYDLSNYTSDNIEEIYQDEIKKAANIDDYYDFILIVHYIVFYLENRRSVVWDQWAQTEILRILFVADELQAEYKDNLNKALSSDSQARNKITQANKRRKKYDGLVAAAEKASPEDVALLKIKVFDMREKLNSLKLNIANQDAERRKYRNDLEQRKNDLELTSQKIRSTREAELSAFFPSLTDYGKYVIAGIESGQGCLVCGSHDKNTLALVIDKLTKTSCCPLCHTERLSQENVDGGIIERSDKIDLSILESRRDEISNSIKTLYEEVEKSQAVYSQLKIECIELEAKYKNYLTELQANEVPLSDGHLTEITKLALQLESDDAEIREEWANKEIALKKLNEIVEQLISSISFFKDDLSSKFGEIVSSFLAEDCYLSFILASRNIGQG